MGHPENRLYFILIKRIIAELGKPGENWSSQMEFTRLVKIATWRETIRNLKYLFTLRLEHINNLKCLIILIGAGFQQFGA